MQESLPSSWATILDAVLESPEPVTLNWLVERGRIRLDRSTIHRHLNAMVDDGLLERRGDRKTATYSPQASLSVRWLTRLGSKWHRIEWRSGPPLDWRYPLASRIPDGPARQVLVQFLEGLQEKALLSPRHFYRTVVAMNGIKADLKTWTPAARRELQLFLESPKFELGLTVIVYGSCARGDARPESDLDVLVVPPTLPPGLRGFTTSDGRFKLKIPAIGYESMVRELSADINLGASRPLDVLCIEEEDVIDLHPGILKSIRQDGITVYGTSLSWFVEAWPKEEGVNE